MSDQKPCVPLRKRLKTIESVPITDVCRRGIVKDNPGEEINCEWQEKLRKLLLCPVCYLTIRPPVKICENGHSVCNECRMSLQNCPLCHANFTETQNVMLAQVSEYVKYPCLNAKGGCPEMCYLQEEKSHLRACAYRIHSCRIEACQWKGSKKDLRVHVETLHGDSVWEMDWYFSEMAELSLKCSSLKREPSSSSKFLIVGNEIFWLCLKYNPIDMKLYRNILYIGTKEMAERFSYQICLKSSDDRRGYQFKSVMDDDSVTGNSVFDSPACATIDETLLRCLSDSSNQRISLECHYSLEKCRRARL